MIEGANEGRGIAHEVVVDSDGLTIAVSIDIANTNSGANITSEEGVFSIRAGSVAPQSSKVLP